jgi:hypothetical protein
VASVRRPEAKNASLARPFGGKVGKAVHAHAMGKPAVDRGLDEIGGKEGERECAVHFADAALLALRAAGRVSVVISRLCLWL